MAKISGPRIFFDIVGTFQANKLLKDSSAAMTAMNAIALDGLTGIMDSGGAIAEQMQAVVDATVPLSAEIERAQIEFQKFLGIGEQFHDGITRQVEDVGMQFGFTATQSLNAGARMAQLSKIIGSETIPAATEMAFAFGLIGDMTPEDAMTKLINLQAQTNFLFEETSRATYNTMNAEQRRLHVTKEMASVLNQLNSIEDKSAATMAKITRVMNEFASQADLTGESIAMMAAMSATLIEAGEEQGKAGRGLRMIYARLGADTSGAASSLHELGIETKNSDGSLRALSDIILDLKPAWDGWNAGQKQNIAQQVAGNRHYVRFIKLMENSDRVIELNNEALIESGAVMSETGEATGYLETLVESNTVALDRQRASLERTAAMWGDVFIPGQIEGIAIQEEVYKLLLNIVNAHGKLGGALSGLVRFKTVIETTYAPMLSALINVKAMTIAMATQKALMRALSGEQLAYANKQQANADMAQIDSDQAIADIMAEIDALEAKRNQQIENSTTNMQISERNDMLANEELLNLKAIKQEIITGGAIKTKIASKDKLIGDYVTNNKQKELLLTQATTAKYDAESIAKGNNMIETRQLQESINQEKNTRQQVIAQIEILIQNLKEFIITNDQYRLSVQEGTMSTEEYEMALFELNLKLQQVEGTTERTKHSFSGMNMVMMKMSMASMGVHMGMSLLSPILFKNKDAAEKARLEMAAMTVTSVIMGIEMLVSMSHMMKNTAAMTGQGAAAGFSAMMNKQLSRALIAVGFSAKTATIWSARLMTVLSLGVMVAVIAGAIWALDKLLKKYDDIGDSAADAAGAVEDLNTSFATNVADAEYTISPDIDFSAATASMQEFAGAREEMFFGFKAGRVTGDMIKQVQQGGIETFISNTEVIMTNNFNGMTTEEVAEQILDEIERGGRARGMAIGA